MKRCLMSCWRSRVITITLDNAHPEAESNFVGMLEDLLSINGINTDTDFSEMTPDEKWGRITIHLKATLDHEEKSHIRNLLSKALEEAEEVSEALPEGWIGFARTVLEKFDTWIAPVIEKAI